MTITCNEYPLLTPEQAVIELRHGNLARILLDDCDLIIVAEFDDADPLDLTFTFPSYEAARLKVHELLALIETLGGEATPSHKLH